MTTSLSQQHVLVLGGSSGIGEATALMAAQAGAHVTIASRSTARLDAALQRLPQGVQAAVLDIENSMDVGDFFASHVPWHHVVVAGSSTQVGPVAQLPLEAAYAAMHNKFWGAYHVARSVNIHAGGALTLVSGVFSQRPAVNAVLQGSINAALESLSRGLALEMAPQKIRVNTISPSTTRTPLWDRLGPQGKEEKFQKMAQRLPVGAIAEPAHIAQAIWMTATNPFMTGSTVLIDGGDALV